MPSIYYRAPQKFYQLARLPGEKKKVWVCSSCIIATHTWNDFMIAPKKTNGNRFSDHSPIFPVIARMSW